MNALHKPVRRNMPVPWILAALWLCITPQPSLAGDKGTEPASTNSATSGRWAETVKLDGVPNLHKVSDTLYRSAQPTSQGMKNLKAMGIKTVVNLRTYHSDKDEIGTTDIRSEHIPMEAWSVNAKDAVRFLKVVANPDGQPVLVHCQHGADRTGSMCAVYRVAVQGWSKEDAVAEMTGGGFGFHKIWAYLPEWIIRLDFDKLRSEAGITNVTASAR